MAKAPNKSIQKVGTKARDSKISDKELLANAKTAAKSLYKDDELFEQVVNAFEEKEVASAESVMQLAQAENATGTLVDAGAQLQTAASASSAATTAGTTATALGGISTTAVVTGAVVVGGVAAAAGGGGGGGGDTPPAVPPTFTLTAGAATAQEGKTITFTLQTTNVAAGTKYDYKLSGIEAADVSDGLTGTATVDSNGKAQITVRLIADNIQESPQKLTITIAGQEVTVNVNNAPESGALPVSGNEDAQAIYVTLVSSDGDGTVTSFVIKSLPSEGTLKSGNTVLTEGSEVLAINGSATVTFVPAANFAGDATFTFAAKDNGGLEDTSVATAAIPVIPVNDAPVITGDLAATVLEAGSYTLTASDLGYTDADDSSTGVTFTVGTFSNGKIQVD